MDDIKVYRGADLTMPTAVAISGTGVVNNKLTLIEKDSTNSPPPSLRTTP